MATQIGYKSSELGMIPQDWEVEELGTVAKVEMCRRIFKNETLNVGDIPFYKIGTFGGEADAYISRQLFEEYKSKYPYPKIGDVLISAAGTIGRVVVFDGEEAYYQDSNIVWLNINKAKISNSFLYYFYQYTEWNSLEGSTIKRLYNNDLLSKKIAIPKSTTEQTAIATALSDTDELISSLQTLIVKKKVIKLSAMQNLLSGKIRLPEFAQRPDGSPKTTRQTELGCVPEDWKIGTIGKDCVLKARIGWQSLRTDEYLENGEYGLITGTDFNNGLVNWKTCSFVSEWRYKQDTNIQLKVKDVLITKDGTIGKLGYINELPFSATLNSGIYVVRPKNSNLIEPMFLFYLFSSEYFNNFISVISAGSTITHLYQKDFVNFQFPLPSKTEQTAISQLLSDMDAEIEALEGRLKKTQALKQGMMQALLTGKIRLPLE